MWQHRRRTAGVYVGAYSRYLLWYLVGMYGDYTSVVRRGKGFSFYSFSLSYHMLLMHFVSYITCIRITSFATTWCWFGCFWLLDSDVRSWYSRFSVHQGSKSVLRLLSELLFFLEHIHCRRAHSTPCIFVCPEVFPCFLGIAKGISFPKYVVRPT